MRILFAGTPDVAVTSLNALADSGHEIAAVLTRPDAPAGRGRTLSPSPVAQRAAELGLPVLKPATLKDETVLEAIRDLAPDAVAVVAYGLIIPAAARDIPRHGWINLHFSLLPAHRGAAPVQAALLAGDTVTGATCFRIEKGLDTGDVLGTVRTPIGPDDTAGTLFDRLEPLGSALLADVLTGLENGTATPVPQDHDAASHTGRFATADARLDWRAPADALDRAIRTWNPHPGAWTLLGENRIKVLSLDHDAAGATGPDADPAAAATGGGIGDDALAPGELRATRRALWVGTGTAPVALGTIAPPGKRAMRAADWARGAQLAPGAAFTVPEEDDHAR